jgi:iron complex outermembrane receptor protein
MRRFWLMSSALTALAAAGAAGAQTTKPAVNPDAADATKVQEIVVTSTRHTANLQNVPATVDAVPATMLKTYNITGVLSLPTLVPGLSITPSGGNNIYLRGVGSASTGYNEAQVAVYVDGVYLANPAMSIYSFNNIDQVEVLKGPQGTLYGRNVTGGLIAVTTRDPGQTKHVDASLGYANYDTFQGNFYGSTPITDTLAANIAVYAAKQNNGWSINEFNGHDIQKSEELGVESKLKWTPTSATKVTASFIYDYNNRDLGYGIEVYPGTLAPDGTPSLGQYRDALRVDPRSPFHAYIGSLKIQQDLGFASLTSLTAYQTSNEKTTFDGSSPFPGEPIAGQAAPYDYFLERSRTFSQELTLTSTPSASRLNWVAGAFYYNDHSELALSTLTTCVSGVCAPGFIPTTNTGYPSTHSYSGYADGTYRFFKATRLTVGLRYTDETKYLSGSVVPIAGQPDSVATLPASTVLYPGEPGLPIVIPTRLHFDKLTYRFVLAQDFTDNIHGYISDNLGFKSGAFNANVFTNSPALPELLYAYEAGVKSELFDHRVRLNLAGFYYDYDNVQVRSTAPPAPAGNALIENAAKERMYGVDGDFAVVVAKGLVVNGGFEVLDAKYVNYPGTTCSSYGTKTVNGVLVGVITNTGCNLAGYTVPLSPPFSANVGFVYTTEVHGGALALSANDHYNTSYPLAPDNSIRQNGHHVLDASLTWTSPNKAYDVQIFGKNLNGAYYFQNGIASNNYEVLPGPPRTYGVTIGFHY